MLISVVPEAQRLTGMRGFDLQKWDCLGKCTPSRFPRIAPKVPKCQANLQERTKENSSVGRNRFSLFWRGGLLFWLCFLADLSGQGGRRANKLPHQLGPRRKDLPEQPGQKLLPGRHLTDLF